MENKRNGYTNKNIGRRPLGRPKGGEITIRSATFLNPYRTNVENRVSS